MSTMSVVRDFGYLPVPELPSDVYWRLSRSRANNKVPQSNVGINYLDNMFQHRFKAKSNGSLSFHDAFYDDRSVQTVIDYICGSGREPTPDLVIRNLKFNVRLPSHFLPDTSSALCRAFANGGSVFDAFTGWGGRSLGAICSGVSRVFSTDIQPLSTESGEAMSRDFSSLSPTICSFLNADFRVFADGFSDKFDLILASPPFFDTEDYGVKADSSVRGWLDGVVIPLVRSSVRLLRPGGYVAVHAQDQSRIQALSIIYAAFSCSGLRLSNEFKYGKKPGQSILVWKLS